MKIREKLSSMRETMEVKRFGLIFVAMVLAVVSVFELAVAFHLQFTQMLVRQEVAMAAGSLMWVVVVIFLWMIWVVIWLDDDEFVWWFRPVVLLFTVITAVSIAGIWFPTFTTFALCANAAIWTLCLVGDVWTFPDAWRACVIDEDEDT